MTTKKQRRPKPPPPDLAPPIPAPREPAANASQATIERYARAFDRAKWQALAWQAVYDRDPIWREHLASRVSEALDRGEELPEPARKWLAWVLRTIDCDGRIPHRCRGRPRNVAGRFDDWRAVHDAMRDRAATHPGETTTKRLKAVAATLHMGDESVREHHYNGPPIPAVAERPDA